MTEASKFELKRGDFFPHQFASESLSITLLSASAFRFARFLWEAVDSDGNAERRSGWTNIQWQNYLADPRCEFYAVFCDGEPAGCCELVQDPRLMRGRVGAVRLKSFGLLKQQLMAGRQAYIVYPLIEESENMD